MTDIKDRHRRSNINITGDPEDKGNNRTQLIVKTIKKENAPEIKGNLKLH